MTRSATATVGPVAAATDAAAAKAGAAFGSHLDEAVAVVLMQASLILRRGHTPQACCDAEAAAAATDPTELGRLAGCGWLAAATVAANVHTSTTTLGWIVSHALSWLDSAAAAADPPPPPARDSAAAASAVAVAAAADPAAVARDSVADTAAVAVAANSGRGPDVYTSWLSLTAAEALERTCRLSDAAAPAVDAALAEAAAIAVDWGEMRSDEAGTVIAAAGGMLDAGAGTAVLMLVDTRDAIAAAAAPYAIPTGPAATAVEAAAAADPAELDRLARRGDWGARAAVAANAHTTTDTLHYLAVLALVVATNAGKHPFPQLASNPQLITDILAAVAANPRTSAATLSIFAHPSDEDALCEGLDLMRASAGADPADPDRDAKERRLWQQWQQLQARYRATLVDRTAAPAYTNNATALT